MTSQNSNLDPRYLYHSPPKSIPQQNSTSNRKLSVSQIQPQQQQNQRGIMRYLTSSSRSSPSTNNSTTVTNQSQQLYYNTSLPPNQFINPTSTAIPGGSARVQPNHLNSSYTIVNNGIHTIPLKQSRTSDKAGVEDSEVRSATPDSTTEPPPPRPIKPSFKGGDDVFFRTDDGQHVLGTVGIIHGQTLQILFGDGTTQWASFKRVKKLSCPVKDDEEPERPNPKTTKQGPSSADQSTANVVNNNEEITCGSCGVVKRVVGRKALNYSPHTAQQFNCRRCLNKSSCNNNNRNMPTILLTQPVRGKTIHLPASSGAKLDLIRDTIESNSRSDICFHCEGETTYNDRLHCNLCARACHLSCLSITPIPLEGDRFWDVICSTCGTQNGESGSAGRTKVFSCRRSITSWSDVAHLVLSCLGTQHPGEKFFDLDQQVIPFIAKRLDRLHLPRTYKNKSTAEKHIFLKTALGNAKLRFLNGKESNKKDTLWAIRDNNNHQGYPLRVPSAASFSSSTSKGPKGSAPTKPSNLTPIPVKSPPNSRYTLPSEQPPLRVHPNSAFANGLLPDLHSNVLASIPFLKASVQSSGSSTGSASPIRSSNVSSTQQESGIGSEVTGSSRTLGKSGTKGLSPKGKGQREPSVPSTSKIQTSPKPTSGKSSAFVASSHSGRLVIKARRHLMSPGIESHRKSELSDTTSDLDNNLDKSPSPTGSESESEGTTDTELTHKITTQQPGTGAVRQAPTKRKLSSDSMDARNIYNKSSNVTDTLSTSPTPDVTPTAKRPKLSDDLQRSCSVNSLKQKGTADQTDKGNKLNRPSSVLLSPIGNKMSDIYKSLNGGAATGGMVNGKSVPEVQSKITPVSVTSKSEIPNISGKAVKTASITSPGNIAVVTSPLKPSLRLRKPKVLPKESDKNLKKEKDLNEGSGAVKKTGGKKNSVGVGKGKGRGRPMKVHNLGNPSVPTALNGDSANSEYSDSSQFSVLKSSVEDFALRAVGCNVLCLPKAPESAADYSRLESKVASLFRSEDPPSAPSYWKSGETGASILPWQKSKRDLSNLDSYKITGRKVDSKGEIMYYCEWRDGYGNDSDDDDGPMYNMDEDLDDPFVLLAKLDQMDIDNVDNNFSNTENKETKDDVEIVPVPGVKLNGKVGNSKAVVEQRAAEKDQDLFMVSGLGLRNKNNLTLKNLNGSSSKGDEVYIDLTDSP